LFDKSRKEFKNRQAVMLGGFVFLLLLSGKQ